MHAGSARHNLPALLTRFIGRETEVAALDRRLADHRLVTLTGPGGVGKSRLALRLAEICRDRALDGVWLVELAPLTDPAVLSSALLAVLRLREEPAVSPLDTLCRSLADRHLLILLDNCEHLLADSAALSLRLLSACPHLQILATSRVPLGVPGEATYDVPPLALPTDGVNAWETLLQSDAVCLFAEPATLGWPEFQVSEENADRVTSICRQLDGLPLAIELAAARVGTLSVAEIAARLSDRFALLPRGGRTAPARQQTLRASLDWSYELLPPPEQPAHEARVATVRAALGADAFATLWAEGQAMTPEEALRETEEKPQAVD
jgi:predicted ATPase